MPGWNVFHVIAECNLWRVYSTAGIPAKRDRISSRLTGSCNHHLSTVFQISDSWSSCHLKVRTDILLLSIKTSRYITPSECATFSSRHVFLNVILALFYFLYIVGYYLKIFSKFSLKIKRMRLIESRMLEHSWLNQKLEKLTANVSLKVVSATFLLVWFKSKREHLRNKEKCFLFHFKSSFRSRENQISEF